MHQLSCGVVPERISAIVLGRHVQIDFLLGSSSAMAGSDVILATYSCMFGASLNSFRL